MSTDKGRVHVEVKYGKVEETFEGTVEETWLLLQKLFVELIPTFEIAKKLELSVDLQRLAHDCEGLIAFSPEGANLLVPNNKLTDNETLALWLLASYLGSRLHLVDSENLSKEELQTKLGKNPKITSTRLGELVKLGVAAKTEDERFKMTTFGVSQMQRDVLPRIIAKIGV